MRRTSAWVLAISILLLGACGSDGASRFADAVGIPAGTDTGDRLSGEFNVRTEITSNECEKNTLLETPQDGSAYTDDIEISQEDGYLTMNSVEEVTIRGAINFDGTYEVGGSKLVDRGGLVENVLKIVLLEGEFKDPNLFEGRGEVRMEGRVDSEEFDCNYRFMIEGIRKGSEATLEDE